METLEFKEGQTYVCTKAHDLVWTVEKEYKVILTSFGIPALPDDEGHLWSASLLNLKYNQFKLKEKTFDLNTLTTTHLREYIDLLENKENADRSINDFIERMSK